MKATTRLMWPPVKMSLTPLMYMYPVKHVPDISLLALRSILHTPPCSLLHCRELILQAALLRLSSRLASGWIQPMGSVEAGDRTTKGRQRKTRASLSFLRCITFGSSFVSSFSQLLSKDITCKNLENVHKNHTIVELCIYI